MESGDRDVSHSNVSVMPSSNSDEGSVLHLNDVHYPYVLQSHTFKDKEVRVRYCVLKDFNGLTHLLLLLRSEPEFLIDKSSVWIHLLWKPYLTQLALK